eukprot:3678890-Amphidinium_carterae.1
MMSEDRDAHARIPQANRDNPGSFRDLRNKVEAMARMAFQMYQKQKNCQTEHDLLLEKCNKLEEDLAQARRDVNIWTEHSRGQEMK